ncbi:hypothetical protein PVK63_19440 [Aliivibrio sp. S2TY2]|uniref:hypothetical protein n=1 Tax=unclassified Aliivibrio TaxID=2645654 RepID=UPI002378FC1D|nr:MULTISPECIES: hypothetical protein [unclassified Aliivibrio]MDD9177038.1 hypothetical protein [Aliivibrio sp. S3TY1]MDD9194123.1 hypothetical protein [Aliivibrio sp. S2TY2]
MFEPLEKLPQICNLYDSADEYLVRVYRQSGNLYRDDRLFLTKTEAIAVVLSTLRRSKRDSAIVLDNKIGLFAIQGMYSAGGSQEGKKVGRIEIYALGRDLPSDPRSISASDAPKEQRYKNTKVFQESKSVDWNKLIPLFIVGMLIFGFFTI